MYSFSILGMRCKEQYFFYLSVIHARINWLKCVMIINVKKQNKCTGFFKIVMLILHSLVHADKFYCYALISYEKTDEKNKCTTYSCLNYTQNII